MSSPDVLSAPRLPELFRAICRYAGVTLPPVGGGDEALVVRTGAEPPGLLALLLEEVVVEDGAEALPSPVPPEPADFSRPAGRVAVRPGFDAPCPAEAELRRAASPGGGPVLLFVVERRGPSGVLRGGTWAAVAEEEPPPAAGFRAAVVRQEMAAESG